MALCLLTRSVTLNCVALPTHPIRTTSCTTLFQRFRPICYTAPPRHRSPISYEAPPRCHPSDSYIVWRSRLHSHLQGSDLSCGQVQDRSERFQKPRNHQMSAGAAPRNIGKWHLQAILDTIRLYDNQPNVTAATSVVDSQHFRELEAVLQGPHSRFVWTIAVEENLKTLTGIRWHGNPKLKTRVLLDTSERGGIQVIRYRPGTPS